MSAINDFGSVSHTPKMATRDKPAWNNDGLIQSLGELTWISGSAVSLNLPAYVAVDEPVGYSSYKLNVDSDPLPSPLTELPSNGIIDNVTLDAIQGGTLNLIFEKTNPRGTTLSSLSIIFVGLPEVAPALANPTNIADLEEGSIVSFNLTDGLTNAESNPVTFSLDTPTSDAFPLNITLNAVTGVASGTVAADQDDGGLPLAYSMQYKVTDNVTGLSDTATQTLTVSVSAATTPTITGASSGVPGCTATAPTWLANLPISFEWVTDVDNVTFWLSDFAVDNGSPILSYAITTGAKPTGTDFNTTTGALTGVPTVSTPGTMEVTATNGVGAGTESVTINWETVAISAPTILSVTGTDGSDQVAVIFDEAQTSPLVDYVTGFTFTVNTTDRALTYVSGAGTAVITYTSAITLSGNNTLYLDYSNATGDLEGVTSGEPLANATNVTSVVPAPPGEGLIFYENFADGSLNEGVTQDNGFEWRAGSSSVISSANPVPGSASAYSLRFTYAGSVSDHAHAERRFSLGDTFYPEVWTKQKIYIPSNYYHRDPGVDNNKLGFLWTDGGYGSDDDYSQPREGPKIGIYLYPNADGTTRCSVYSTVYIDGSYNHARQWRGDSTGTCGHSTNLWGEGNYTNFISSNDLGQWMTLITGIKYASEASYDAAVAASQYEGLFSPCGGYLESGLGDGVMEVYKTAWNGTEERIINIQNADWFGTKPNTPVASRGLNFGHLMGYANSGFDEDTVFYVGEISWATTKEDLM